MSHHTALDVTKSTLTQSCWAAGPLHTHLVMMSRSALLVITWACSTYTRRSTFPLITSGSAGTIGDSHRLFITSCVYGGPAWVAFCHSSSPEPCRSPPFLCLLIPTHGREKLPPDWSGLVGGVSPRPQNLCPASRLPHLGSGRPSPPHTLSLKTLCGSPPMCLGLKEADRPTF